VWLVEELPSRLAAEGRRACTPLQKGKACWECPAGLRDAASPPGLAGEDVAFGADQFAVGDGRRGLRDVVRRRPEDSTGTVPLQSGNRLHDQKTPFLPLHWRVVAPHAGQTGPAGKSIDSTVPRYC
jgi:hypothetical protein